MGRAGKWLACRRFLNVTWTGSRHAWSCRPLLLPGRTVGGFYSDSTLPRKPGCSFCRDGGGLDSDHDHPASLYFD